MATDFLGTYENKVNNSRVVIPAPFKAKLSDETKQTVVYTLGAKNNCIVIYPVETWQQLVEKLSNGDSKAKKQLGCMRNFAYYEQLEGPGRIKIDEKLLNITNIKDKGDVIILGQGSYISLWEPSKYEEMSAQYLQSNDFDAEDYQV